MVVKQTVTIDHFLPDARPVTQWQQPQGKSPTSPPPPLNRSRKSATQGLR